MILEAGLRTPQVSQCADKEVAGRRFILPTLQQQIAEKFLTKLAESKAMDVDRIDQLRSLLADNKKLKADDLVKIFAQPAGGDLK